MRLRVVGTPILTERLNTRRLSIPHRQGRDNVPGCHTYAIVAARLETTSVGKNRDLVFVWLRTRAPTTFKFGDAIQELAGVPRGTVRSALDEARHRGAVELRGTGRGAHWVIVNRSAVESAAQTIA